MSDYPPSQKLWRYMSFSRFMRPLQRKLRWIGRSDTLDAPWELAITPTHLEEVRLHAPITDWAGASRDRRRARGKGLWTLATNDLHQLLVRLGTCVLRTMEGVLRG